MRKKRTITYVYMTEGILNESTIVSSRSFRNEKSLEKLIEEIRVVTPNDYVFELRDNSGIRML